MQTSSLSSPKMSRRAVQNLAVMCIAEIRRRLLLFSPAQPNRPLSVVSLVALCTRPGSCSCRAPGQHCCSSVTWLFHWVGSPSSSPLEGALATQQLSPSFISGLVPCSPTQSVTCRARTKAAGEQWVLSRHVLELPEAMKCCPAGLVTFPTTQRPWQ